MVAICEPLSRVLLRYVRSIPPHGIVDFDRVESILNERTSEDIGHARNALAHEIDRLWEAMKGDFYMHNGTALHRVSRIGSFREMIGRLIETLDFCSYVMGRRRGSAEAVFAPIAGHVNRDGYAI